MLEIMHLLFIGFSVGLSGALVPGPMLFATIDSSMRTGWKAGPKIVMGHAGLEMLVIVLILAGVFSVLEGSIPKSISVIGGIVLILFGVFTAKNGYEIKGNVYNKDGSASNTAINPYIAGILTSASNPYFWIWWITAGTALMFYGLEVGIVAMFLFIIGHWLADIGWYSAVSLGFSRGKTLMSFLMYKYIIIACGTFLVIFGAWFIVN
ncbi:LysE family translocator [Methanosalsum natronophilum]|uniref:LysE family translocator n=1 Tax=Methanosalsum natronophilum TaxID=768733 RepID=A0A3R7VR74_9EURY|nr:MAG: LysE family translocator [Methanosalsum natronophilum]